MLHDAVLSPSLPTSVTGQDVVTNSAGMVQRLQGLPGLVQVSTKSTPYLDLPGEQSRQIPLGDVKTLSRLRVLDS